MEYVIVFGGAAEVYARIAGLTDCQLLHREFEAALRHNLLAKADSAEYRRSLGYMQAADDRMEAVGCYDGPRAAMPQ
jgi:hypothetical protein